MSLSSKRGLYNDSLKHFDYQIYNILSCLTDLGVSCDLNVNFRPYINNTVAKASLRAKLILKCFRSRQPTVLLMVFWNRYYRIDIDTVETVHIGGIEFNFKGS